MPFERFPKDGNWARTAARQFKRFGGNPLAWFFIGWEIGGYFGGNSGGWQTPDAGWVYLPGCEGEAELHSPTIYTGGCIQNQAGVWPGDPSPAPFVIQRAVTGRRRWGVGYYRESNVAGRVTHVRSYYKDYYPPHPAAAPTETKPVNDVPYYEPPKAPSWGSARLGWSPNKWPDWMPVAPPFVLEPVAPPLGTPNPSNPGTPQWPDHGPKPSRPPRPRPQPDPDPVPHPFPGDTTPFPGLEPYAPPVPNVGGLTLPISSQGTMIALNPNGSAKAWPRPDHGRVRRPPRGTKERKTLLRGRAAQLWRWFGPPTEFADLIDSMYKCMPKKMKRQQFIDNGFAKVGRAARAQIIYENINDLDVGCFIAAYLENQVEDFVFGRAGQALGRASANRNSPFGYGTGPAL